jgi:hypothetical protein
MTLPRTAAEVLSGHVTLEVRCMDRVLLTFRQPRLQYGQGIHGFFCYHRGNQFASSALMMPMTERFAADIRHYIDTRRLDLVRFAKGESKDQVAREYLAGKSGGDQILFVGVAQEKARIWRTSQRRDPATGKRYPWLYQDQAMVNHWYFYGFDAGFGPFYIKFCGYFPYTGQIYLNGHEYAKQQCRKEGIAFTALDNAFGTASDAEAVQRICDGLDDQKIYRFAGKWLARLPQPFTRADEDADYRWQLSVQQVEFSTTMAVDRPLNGRIFFDQLIRDNLDIGRPDKVNIVFGRQIRHRGKSRTPGTFRTQVITSGTCPYLYLFYKKTQVKQYLKEGRALRTETTLNQPRDFGIGKELTNLAAMAEAGYTANRRLLDAECISHDPADGAAALETITSPVISTTCTRIPGMRFPDPRVQALLGACCALALRPAGFTSRDLRHYLAPQLGKTPEDMTGGQISYDLRRLRAHQLIERIPHSRNYQVTQDGLSIALFLTRLTQRLLIPGLAQLTSPGPPGRSRLRQADRAYRDALTNLARQASLVTLVRPPAAITCSDHRSPSDRHQPSHTTQLDSKFKIPAGKDNLLLQPSRVRLCDECRSTILVARRVCSTVIEATGALPRGRLGHCNAGTDRTSEPSKLL